MAKSINQKLKLLYLVDILNRETDEQHPLNAQQLIEKLEAHDIKAERKSIYDDMEQLIQYGYDIVLSKSRKNGGYYMATRVFQLPELKILVDSVSASKFITKKKSRELIAKLEKFASRYEENQLQRQVYVSNRIKAENESIFYNVDEIHLAIQDNKMISFQYLAWNTGKEMMLKNDGKPYLVSPLGLLWNDENYYLIAYENERGIRHYRVDKMKNIKIQDELRQEESGYRDFDIAMYANTTFGMYGGKEEMVSLLFPKELSGVMIDRFGKELTFRKEDGDNYSVRVSITVSKQFFGWLTGLGKSVKLIKPENVKVQYKEYLEEILKEI